MFLVAGRRHRPGTTHHTARETQPSPPSHCVRGEQEPLSLSPAGSARLPCAAASQGFCRTAPRWKTVQEQTGGTGFPFLTQRFVVLMSSHREVCTTILSPQGTDRGSPAPPLSGFTMASKPGRALPTGKGFLASSMCWDQTPDLFCPGWTLALKTMMEMSRSNRDALLMVLPHSEHAGATKLWMHGSVSCPLKVVILGEESPVSAHRKLRIRGRDPRNTTVPGFPTTTKDNRGASTHLQATP